MTVFHTVNHGSCWAGPYFQVVKCTARRPSVRVDQATSIVIRLCGKSGAATVVHSSANSPPASGRLCFGRQSHSRQRLRPNIAIAHRGNSLGNVAGLDLRGKLPVGRFSLCGTNGQHLRSRGDRHSQQAQGQ